MTNIEVNNPLNDFLSVKYFISCTNEESEEYKLYKKTDNYQIYLNNNYKDLGFVFNNYISNEEFLSKNTLEKYQIINNTIVLNNDQINKYKDLYNDDVKVFSNTFKFINNGFNSKIDVSKDTLVLYTIPYDKGWRAFVNESKVEIEKVDNGLIAIKINKGVNNIAFTYYPPGLKAGLILTIVSFIILLAYIFLNNKSLIYKKILSVFYKKQSLL